MQNCLLFRCDIAVRIISELDRSYEGIDAIQLRRLMMKCLRVYSTADGESHFDEVEIATTPRQVHPSAAVFEASSKYMASSIRFTQIPADAGQVDWHTVPERVLTVRLDGSAEYQTSDGDVRSVPAGSFVLFEDVNGKGHKSLHSPQEQKVLWISMPQGFNES